jgi:hypothetical protein
LPSPDQSPEPIWLSAVVCSISSTGLSFQTQLSRGTYAELLKTPRFCRVNLSEPDLPNQLTAKVVWIQPESNTTKASFLCSLGLYFEGIGPDAHQQINEYIKTLSRKTNNMSAAKQAS